MVFPSVATKEGSGDARVKNVQNYNVCLIEISDYAVNKGCHDEKGRYECKRLVGKETLHYFRPKIKSCFS